MRTEITLKTGSTLSFQEPQFEEACDLLEILATELLKVNVELGDITKYIASEGHVSELLADPKILNTMKNAVCQMLASKPFKAALMTCTRRSMLNGEKITKETFEKQRADYLPVCWEVARETLLPFISSLGLKLSSQQPEAKASQ